MGGTVNLASRIEGLFRDTRESVLAPEAVRAQAPQAFARRALNPCEIRGLDAPITPIAPSRPVPLPASVRGDTPA